MKRRQSHPRHRRKLHANRGKYKAYPTATIPEGEGLHGQAEVGAMLGVAERTLERWRWTGEGPVFVKMSNRCFYRRSDLRAFIEARLRTSTSATEPPSVAGAAA